jgi:hypothetical protein
LAPLRWLAANDFVRNCLAADFGVLVGRRTPLELQSTRRPVPWPLLWGRQRDDEERRSPPRLPLLFSVRETARIRQTPHSDHLADDLFFEGRRLDGSSIAVGASAKMHDLQGKASTDLVEKIVRLIGFHSHQNAVVHQRVAAVRALMWIENGTPAYNLTADYCRDADDMAKRIDTVFQALIDQVDWT